MPKTKKSQVESSEWIEKEWRENSSQIYKLCRLWSSDSESAKDLFQEVALRFCKSAASLDRERPMFPWFATVVRNSCRSQYRQSVRTVPESRIRCGKNGFPVTVENLAESRVPYDAKPECVVKHELEYLMSDLSSSERQAVEYTFIGGMALCDVGRLLGVSKNAVGKRRAKALDKMVSKKKERAEMLEKIGASPYLAQDLLARRIKIS